MTTIARAQRAIDKARVPLEIVRGEGYHYFIWDVPHREIYEIVSVMVPYTKDYTPTEWANQAALAWIGMEERVKSRGY